jgi:uncharacterized metal-binding protein
MTDCCNTPEEDAADCCCSGDNVLLFACSGGSNVGQIANEAAKKLDEEGLGKFHCLIGVGAGIEGMLVNARGADRIVAIDGCPVACAKIALEKAGLKADSYVVVTDEGVEKGHHFSLTDAEVQAVCDAARSRL